MTATGGPAGGIGCGTTSEADDMFDIFDMFVWGSGKNQYSELTPNVTSQIPRKFVFNN